MLVIITSSGRKIARYQMKWTLRHNYVTLALQTVNLVFFLSEIAIANSFVRQGQDIGHKTVKKSVTVFPKRLRA